MGKFTQLDNKIFNVSEIKEVEVVGKDVRLRYACRANDYKDDYYPVDIYIRVKTTDNTYDITILDDDWDKFVSFIADIYDCETEKARKIAWELTEKAKVFKELPSEESSDIY